MLALTKRDLAEALGCIIERTNAIDSRKLYNTYPPEQAMLDEMGITLEEFKKRHSFTYSMSKILRKYYPIPQT